MINTLKLYFQNLPFRKKITSICLLISLIPVILMGVLAYLQIRSQMIDREETALFETLRQETDVISNRLSDYNLILNTILWDEAIKTGLLQDYPTNYDLYLFYKQSIDPLFLTLRSLNKDLTAVTLYTDGPAYPHGSYINTLDSAKEMPWYEQALTSTVPFYEVSSDYKTLYLVCQMYYPYPAPVTIVCLAIDMNTLFATAKTIGHENYGFGLLDESGSPLFTYATFSESSRYCALSASELQSHAYPDTYVAAAYTLSSPNWTVWFYRPLDDLHASLRQLTVIAACIVAACIFLSFSAAATLSRLIVAPLEKLSADMSKVEQGNYEITVVNDRKDEIGNLIHSFHTMVVQLNHLINEVLRARISQQNYELRILQAQINPHFLYNSLSLINGKAIMTHQTEISQMAQLLSTFYRTMLNKGKNITTVSAELENLRAYVSIQQMMHAYSFEVNYDIDEQILTAPILNLILQPLAENAILHGLDHREAPGQGILSISCYPEGKNIIIKVMDNGHGMSKEECQKILTADSKGYGIKNVHQRIQLYYGSAYGLSYHSTPGMGTCVTLKVINHLTELK